MALSVSEISSLADEALSHLSFKYEKLIEAIYTVKSGEYYYTFDASSMLPYETNLDEDSLSEFYGKLRPYYKNMCYKHPRDYQELTERRVLFHYLVEGNSEYKDYQIKKTERPDFTLIGLKKVGIELVELTTPIDQNLFSITRSQFGESKSLDEIKTFALKHHKTFAKQFSFYDLDGTPAIAAGLFNVNERQDHFANLLCRKYKKYEEMLPEFDEFIILGNTADGSGIEISCESDVDCVLHGLQKKLPEIKGVTIAILWEDAYSRRHMTHKRF
ncbi:MAG: hypothetical protein IJV30_00585 [Oscillospiraceae bacterium]|nr:hypothetical protein [Oscillospiraceae bacterium]